MSQLFITVVGGLLVVIIAALFGFGGTTKVSVLDGGKVKKTGKWIIIISVVMFFIGLSLCKKSDPTQWGFDLNIPSTLYGVTIMLYAGLFFFVGKIVAWFQRP
jgi:hypothetical protein